MANVLTAITVIIQNLNSTNNLRAEIDTGNRANQAGQALEDFVKNAFADCFTDDKETQINKKHVVFSYEGNSHNPPDAILREGDVIEIKKVNSANKPLQLNSSYPKNKLHSDNSKITEKCRTCEEWSVKDMIYVIGHVEDDQIKLLFFVYGDIYCDDKIAYERIVDKIKDGIREIDDVEFSETDELGKVKKIDHLGITDLRIRGMWMIESPMSHFDYIVGSESHEFKLVALIPEDKYNQFGQQEIEVFERFCEQNNVTINEVNVQNPQNPAELIKTKSIIYTK